MPRSGNHKVFVKPPPAAGATLAQWLTYAETAIAHSGAALGQSATNPHDEALALLLHVLKLPLESGPRVLARHLRSRERAEAIELLRRRLVDRIPLAYLIGEAWLAGARFYVDPRAIIPRSYFVEIIPRLRLSGPPAIADVCTGSGCLAILLARHFPQAQVDAIELDPAALEVAQINVAAHRLRRRVHLWASDVFDAMPLRQYSLIVSNPPYEPTARVDALPEEFRREPRQALDGGPDGLAIIRKLIAQAMDRLAPGGSLLIEVGGLRRAIDREFKRLGPEWLETADGSNCVCRFRNSG